MSSFALAGGTFCRLVIIVYFGARLSPQGSTPAPPVPSARKTEPYYEAPSPKAGNESSPIPNLIVMKTLLFLFLLIPMAVQAQEPGKELIFEITELRVSPDKVPQFEAGVAAHNKKYHASGPAGVRVYWVASGPHAGEYRWVMGPGPWSALDGRPQDDAHGSDWQFTVGQHTLAGGSNDYIRYDPALSRFPKDFTIGKLWVTYYDVAKGKMDAVKETLKKGHAVYRDKIPGDTYGVYFNEMPGGEYDFTIVWFFDKYAQIPVDNGFGKMMEEVYGKEAAEQLWKDWDAHVTVTGSEIWEFRPDLSGLDGKVMAAERQ